MATKAAEWRLPVRAHDGPEPVACRIVRPARHHPETAAAAAAAAAAEAETGSDTGLHAARVSSKLAGEALVGRSDACRLGLASRVDEHHLAGLQRRGRRTRVAEAHELAGAGSRLARREGGELHHIAESAHGDGHGLVGRLKALLGTVRGRDHHCQRAARRRYLAAQHGLGGSRMAPIATGSIGVVEVVAALAFPVACHIEDGAAAAVHPSHLVRHACGETRVAHGAAHRVRHAGGEAVVHLPADHTSSGILLLLCASVTLQRDHAIAHSVVHLAWRVVR